MFNKRSSRYLFVDDIAVPRGRQRRWPKLMTVAIALLVVTMLSGLQVVYAATEQQLQATQSKQDIGAGQLLFNSETAGQRHTAITLASEVHFDVSGMLAHVTLRQSFLNDSDTWREGVYVFPLPDDAAVNALRIRIGERVIEGAIHEKSQAKAIYQQAKNSGRKAALVEQERPNLFTNSIANIGPGEMVEVEIEYLQGISYDSGVFALRFPMTITPRYIPGQPRDGDSDTQISTSQNGIGRAANTDQVSDAARITPAMHAPAGAAQLVNPIRITAQIDMGMPLQSVVSAYHDIDVAHDGDQYSLSLSAGSVPMTQDFKLCWRPQPGSEPQAAWFTETLNDQEFALLMIVPPQQLATTNIPKEQTYVIDTSGSMAGVSIRQAQQSLLLALTQLKPQDRFNIIEFNSTTRPLFSQALPASSENIEQAQRFVRHLQARGGTEMAQAVTAALHSSDDGAHLRQVIFITDGAVGNEAALFKLIQQQLGHTRLFTVGIGSAPNSYFMRKAAQFGRGSFTHIGDVTEVSAKMKQLFDKLESPALQQITIEWPVGIDPEMYPPRTPDLYYGEPLLLSARLSALPDSITVRGASAEAPWRQKIVLGEDVTAQKNSKGVATLWARQKIAGLLDEIIVGRDEQEVRAEVLPLALAHQLVSPYTSFVAVEQQASNISGETPDTTAIPNAQPKGLEWQSLAYPAGASNAAQSIMWGLLLLSFGAIFVFCIRKEEQYALRA